LYVTIGHELVLILGTDAGFGVRVGVAVIVGVGVELGILEPQELHQLSS
jgi:hypothetical protein